MFTTNILTSHCVAFFAEQFKAIWSHYLQKCEYFTSTQTAEILTQQYEIFFLVLQGTNPVFIMQKLSNGFFFCKKKKQNMKKKAEHEHKTPSM